MCTWNTCLCTRQNVDKNRVFEHNVNSDGKNARALKIFLLKQSLRADILDDK